MLLINKNKTKQLHKYHLTARIERKITYTNKTGAKKTYKESEHERKLVGHDNLYDSRIVEASSLQEAQKIYEDMIVQESTFEEYSSNALVDVDNVHFIDDSPIQDAMIQHSNPRNMPLRQASYIEYNFTKQETKYLSNENTCVIDNLVGLYGEELKLDKEKLIKINKTFHGIVDIVDSEPQYIENDLGDLIINSKFNDYNQLPKLNKELIYNIKQFVKTEHEYYNSQIERLDEIINEIKTNCKPDNYYDTTNAFTPAFIEYFCKMFGISHYAFDINKTCFMKYVHKNQNHRCLCYYAMNNHMYLVKDKDYVKSMVEKAKAPEHKIHTSSLELDEVVNHYLDKEIYLK